MRPFLAAILILSAAVPLIATAGKKTTPFPSGDATVFQDATNVVFRLSLGVEKDKDGKEIPKWKQFNVSDAKLLTKLASSIQLVAGAQFSDEHIYDATFQRPAGNIIVQFCPQCFIIVDKQQPYEARHFAMPKQFYKEFKTLARQQGWKVERK